MARWITIIRPFDYRWPDATAVTHHGESVDDPMPRDEFVKDDVADFAIANGHAKERKSGKRKSPDEAASATVKADAQTTDPRSDNPVDGASVVADDRVDDRRAVDEASGER